MKWIYWIVVLIAGSTMSSCASTSNLRYDYSAEEFHDKFNKYTSYAWIPYDYQFCKATGPAIYQSLCNNPVYERLLRDEVNEYLYVSGLDLELHNPDLLITYKIVFKDITLNELVRYKNSIPYTQAYPPGDPTVMSPYNKITGNYTIHPDNFIYDAGGNIFLPNEGYTSTAPNQFSMQRFPEYTYETLLREGTLVIEVIDRRSNYIVWTGWSKEVINGPVEFRMKLQPIIQQIMKKFPGIQ